MPRDANLGFVSGQTQTVVDEDAAYAAQTMAGTGLTSNADGVCNVREFLEDAGILSSTEDVKRIVEMRAYVQGRCAR